MKILIWGVPCVGKTSIGRLLAKKLNYKYIDMNEIFMILFQPIMMNIKRKNVSL